MKVYSDSTSHRDGMSLDGIEVDQVEAIAIFDGLEDGSYLGVELEGGGAFQVKRDGDLYQCEQVMMSDFSVSLEVLNKDLARARLRAALDMPIKGIHSYNESISWEKEYIEMMLDGELVVQKAEDNKYIVINEERKTEQKLEILSFTNQIEFSLPKTGFEYDVFNERENSTGSLIRNISFGFDCFEIDRPICILKLDPNFDDRFSVKQYRGDVVVSLVSRSTKGFISVEKEDDKIPFLKKEALHIEASVDDGLLSFILDSLNDTQIENLTIKMDVLSFQPNKDSRDIFIDDNSTIKLTKISSNTLFSEVVDQKEKSELALQDEIRCAFKFKCPLTWNELAPTEDRAVRFCSHCESNVHWVDNEAQLLKFVQEGNCVAYKYPEESIEIGRPGAPYLPDDEVGHE
jgi:hypothetical protein